MVGKCISPVRICRESQRYGVRNCSIAEFSPSAKFRSPCAWWMSRCASRSPISGRRKRTSILRLWRRTVPKSYPSQHKGLTDWWALCVGWGSWIRTSENARVKVWCLTAWLYPNIWLTFGIISHFIPRVKNFFCIFAIFLPSFLRIVEILHLFCFIIFSSLHSS